MFLSCIDASLTLSPSLPLSKNLQACPQVRIKKINQYWLLSLKKKKDVFFVGECLQCLQNKKEAEKTSSNRDTEQRKTVAAPDGSSFHDLLVKRKGLWI